MKFTKTKKPKMASFVLIVLSLTVLFSLSACVANEAVKDSTSPAVIKMRDLDSLTGADYVYLHAALTIEEAESKGKFAARKAKVLLAEHYTSDAKEVDVLSRTGASNEEITNVRLARYEEQLATKVNSFRNITFKKSFRYNAEGRANLEATIKGQYSNGSINFIDRDVRIAFSNTISNHTSTASWRQWMSSGGGPNNALAIKLNNDSKSSVIVPNFLEVSFKVPYDEADLKKVIVSTRRMSVSFDTTITLKPKLERMGPGVYRGVSNSDGSGLVGRVNFVPTVASVANITVR